MFKKYKDLLTIGITAYNEEKFIRETIESCANQAGSIIICDNASTDNTSNICRELAKKYNNIHYTRLEKDLGKEYGYNFVLKETKTKYFMWLGAHDLLDQNYTSPMIHMLENSSAVGCYPASRSIDLNNNEIGIYDCWYANDLISNSPANRIYSLINNLHEVSAFYGIYQTEIAQKYPLENIIGSDHVFLCNIAANGKLIYSPRSIFNWRQNPDLDYVEIIKLRKKSSGIPESRANHKEMRDRQLEILKKCPSRNLSDFFNKIRLVNKAKKKLQKRFPN